MRSGPRQAPNQLTNCGATRASKDGGGGGGGDGGGGGGSSGKRI